MRWRAVLYVKDNKKDLYSIEAMVLTSDRMQAISMISQYAFTMTDDKTKDIKIIIRPGKAGEDNITDEGE
jgi:hypothetical protein